jgi:hypothetical protein
MRPDPSGRAATTTAASGHAAVHDHRGLIVRMLRGAAPAAQVAAAHRLADVLPAEAAISGGSRARPAAR